MILQLKSISANLIKCAELLEKIPSTSPGIQNVINENAWHIKQLEAYAAKLAENIELTFKTEEK